jgi:hypothetical protein
MKFFDKVDRDLSEEVFVIKKIKVVGSNPNFTLLRELPQTQGEAFYKTTVEHLEVGDAILKEDGLYVTYRVE